MYKIYKIYLKIYKIYFKIYKIYFFVEKYRRELTKSMMKKVYLILNTRHSGFIL